MEPTRAPKADAEVPATEAAVGQPKAPDIEVAVSVVDAQTIRDQAAEVSELCGLAGQPKMAAGFIRSAKPLADVRAELLKARADQDASTEIYSQVPLGSNADSGRGATTANPGDSPIEKAAERLAGARKEK